MNAIVRADTVCSALFQLTPCVRTLARGFGIKNSFALVAFGDRNRRTDQTVCPESTPLARAAWPLEPRLMQNITKHMVKDGGVVLAHAVTKNLALHGASAPANKIRPQRFR
jgi:hypothetical protein